MEQPLAGVQAPAKTVPLEWGGVRRAARSLLPLVYLAGSAAIFGAIWGAAALWSKDLPAPVETLHVFWQLVSNPFYDNGPNDKGIGIQLLASMKRVAIGFSLGTLVAVPLGLIMGASPVGRKLLDPIVQVLRPISPLAWFPIGLAALHSANNAAVFIIFITSLWPTVINTAFGVNSVPPAHKNVARVFHFSRSKYLFRVLLPFSLPHILTGLRLSFGIAWLVIVAGEMLSGGTGIGFFVWDSWNSLNLARTMAAVLTIGLVGLLTDQIFQKLVRQASYEEA